MRKPTDEAAELTIEVICSLEGLINHTEVKTLIAVSSPLELTQTRLSSVSKMLLPVHINSVTMTQTSELVSYAQFSANTAMDPYSYWL